MDIKDINYRLDQLYFDIIITPAEQRLDLKRMWRTCMDIRDEISKEDVNCRRLGKDSLKKQELMLKLEDSFNTLEQYLTWAKLLG